MDEAAKKQMLRLFTYGLYAVTARDGERGGGDDGNWAAQVSFAPPLIAVSMERESRTRRSPCGRVVRALRLRGGSAGIRGQLGRHSAKVPEKFAGVAWTPGSATGCPLIDGTLGALECRVTSTMEAGDSVLVLAEVVAAHALREGEPLTMQAAGFKHAG